MGRRAHYADPANPHGSECKLVRRLAWGQGRAPRADAFRLGEHPDVTLLRRDLAVALSKALKKALVIAEPPYPVEDGAFSIDPRPVPLRQGSTYGLPGRVRPWQAAAEAARSAQAFWSLHAGSGSQADRAAACASAHYAFWLALAVDRAPADDTREGALADPGYAFVYACAVDRAPREDTRRAACGAAPAAMAYVTFVDRGPHEVTRRAVAGTEWEAGYPKLAAADAPPAPSAPPPTAARAWPEHGAPRYAEDGAADAPAPAHAPLESELRSDIDEFIDRGLKLLGKGDDARPEEVVAAAQAFVAEVQAKTRKLSEKKEARMGLGCAFGEQFHRALGWQWASVKAADGGGVALVSPDRAVALYPFAILERLLAPRARESTLVLIFEMIAADDLPPGARPGAYAALV